MICFIHIERAGGTTLHYVFRNNYPLFLTLNPWYYWANEEKNVFSFREARYLFRFLPDPGAFGGHTARSYLGYEDAIGKPIEYVTFLREPVARYISHYLYQKYVMGIEWSIESFLSESRFNNFMTKRIAGCFDVEKAKAELAKKFSFVGITEQFDASLLLMKGQLGLTEFDIRYDIKNAVPRIGRSEELGDYIDSIRECNELDIELYKFAHEEIFNTYKEKYGSRFDGDLEESIRQNQTFKFSPALKVSRAMYRLFYYRNMEYIAKKLFHE